MATGLNRLVTDAGFSVRPCHLMIPVDPGFCSWGNGCNLVLFY